MAAGAAELVDHILAHVPVRQWVLSLPHALRYRLAWDHTLCRAVLRVYTRALLGFERRRGRRRGIVDGRSGSVTAIQRFGSGLQANVHFHTLVLDGVFATAPDGTMRFDPAPPPTDREVAHLLVAIRTRILRLLRQRGVLAADDATDLEADPLAVDTPVLAQISAAAVRGRSAFGDRAGTPVLRVGHAPDAPWVWTVGPRHAHLERFDLHADRAVCADDRLGLERLCRYLLRPPLAQERLSRLADGRVVCTLRHPWHDGTRHLIFTPHEFLERLAAITPRPRINLVIYHGLLAPRARRRPRVSDDPAVVTPPVPLSTASALLAPPMASGPATPSTAASPAPSPIPPPASAPELTPSAVRPAPSLSPPAAQRLQHAWAWADLMRRVFSIDVLACAGCGGRLRFIATIEDPPIVTKILTHLGLPTELPAVTPARSPPQHNGFDFP